MGRGLESKMKRSGRDEPMWIAMWLQEHGSRARNLSV
jgi:hypothetical protein